MTKLLALILVVFSANCFCDSSSFVYREKFEAYDCAFTTDVVLIGLSLSCGPQNDNAKDSYCYGSYECKLKPIGAKEGTFTPGKRSATAFCKPNKNNTCPEAAECVTREFKKDEVTAKVARVQTSEQALAEMKASTTHNASGGTPAVAQSSNPNHPDRK